MTSLGITSHPSTGDPAHRNFTAQGWMLQGTWILILLCVNGIKGIFCPSVPQNSFFSSFISTASYRPIPLFFKSTKLFPSLTVKILGLSFTCNLDLKSHISSITEVASLRLDILYHLQKFFSPANFYYIQGPTLSLYRVCNACLRVPLILPFWMELILKFFCIIGPPSLSSGS